MMIYRTCIIIFLCSASAELSSAACTIPGTCAAPSHDTSSMLQSKLDLSSHEGEQLVHEEEESEEDIASMQASGRMSVAGVLAWKKDDDSVTEPGCGDCIGCLRQNGVCKTEAKWDKAKCDYPSKQWGVGKWCPSTPGPTPAPTPAATEPPTTTEAPIELPTTTEAPTEPPTTIEPEWSRQIGDCGDCIGCLVKQHGKKKCAVHTARKEWGGRCGRFVNQQQYVTGVGKWCGD